MAGPQRRTADARGGATAGPDIDISALPPAGEVESIPRKVDRLRRMAVKTNKMTTAAANAATNTSAATAAAAAASDMSKQDVEALVRRLTLDELKTKRFVDEIVSKVTTELVESPLPSPAATPRTETAPSPRSSLAKPRPSQWRAYQATVEDETASQADVAESLESDTRTQASSYSNCSSPSSVVAESVSSKASNGSSIKKTSKTVRTPPDSAQSSPKPRPTVHFSDHVPVILHSRNSPPRPRKAEMNTERQIITEREVNDTGLSAVDLKWGDLFNDRFEPTARLGQFLRGIANYMIAEYTPTNSLVVTPEKLLAFYRRYKLDSEVFPFQQIFDTEPKGALDNLEDLYRDLRCNYFLVQSRPNSRAAPYIPALTPTGFADWMIQQIQAFPDQEAKRLNRVIAELPIEADTSSRERKPERLPKQLSRRLFPKDRHRDIHDNVVKAVNAWLRSAGYAKPVSAVRQRPSRDDSYRSSRSSVDSEPRDDSGRRKSEKDRKSAHGSKHGRDSEDSHLRQSVQDYHRPEPPGRHISRSNSEQLVRHPREISPPPVGSHHRVRSPASSNRYRNSVPSLSTTSDDYGLSSTSHHGSVSAYPGSSPQKGDRRTREQEYRIYQGREPRSVIENTPRSLGHSSKRQSLLLPGSSQEHVGASHDDYIRTSPRVLRTSAFDDAGSYHSGHSGSGA